MQRRSVLVCCKGWGGGRSRGGIAFSVVTQGKGGIQSVFVAKQGYWVVKLWLQTACREAQNLLFGVTEVMMGLVIGCCRMVTDTLLQTSRRKIGKPVKCIRGLCI